MACAQTCLFVLGFLVYSVPQNPGPWWLSRHRGLGDWFEGSHTLDVRLKGVPKDLTKIATSGIVPSCFAWIALANGV